MSKKAYADMNVPELKEEAAKRGIEGHSSMRKDELVAALESAGPPDDAGADEPPARAPRDNRRILKGVQFPDNGTIKTYSGDDPATLDELESKLTPEQLERLIEQGALDGDWTANGEPLAPMPRSRADKAANK